MKKVLQVFNSFAEAEEADKKYYRSLTPAQRIEILLILRSLYKQNDNEPRGRLKRVYRILNALKARYIVVDAFALAYHGYPRYTGDIDLLLNVLPRTPRLY
jgi:hypothetical protein